MENNRFNNSNLINLIILKRKLLLIVGSTALMVSLVISLFIKDKFKSTVILYPTTTNSISKAIIAENFSNKEDVLKFGEVEEAEQLLQILNSDEIKHRIIEKYNLL
ncbi:MAG: hypothetical protein A3K10_16535 [Bacteroidetes bacterium RIFCSPLOWO2_12_FULL_31_6]|nr:MAG: hypothetical protein A3K10_16535 [Bacteroidetes bacterium RIFCSPLOWO2_12_FULL_31_6]